MGEGVAGGNGSGAVFGALGLDNLAFNFSILLDNMESIVLYVSCNGGKDVCVFLFYILRAGWGGQEEILLAAGFRTVKGFGSPKPPLLATG